MEQLNTQKQGRRKKLVSLVIFLTSGLFFLMVIPVFAGDINNPFTMPGRTQGTGTFFEITDSRYLNITLESSKEVNLIMESIPRMISLNIGAVESNPDFVLLSLKGLQPNITYYMYQNSHKNETVFIADENGTFTWSQDLSESLHIWIQEQKSTTYIEEDTTLDSDIIGSVEISVSGVILDCNGHNITGTGSGYGIYLYNKTNTTIRNCNISNFSYGIYLGGSGSLYNTISNNNVFANEYGLFIQSSSWSPQSSNNYIFNNQIYSNVYQGMELYGTNTNQVIGNSVSNNGGIGFLLNWAPSNYLRNNTITNNDYNFGVYGGWVSAEEDIDISNTVNGKPIYYWVNVNTLTIDVSLNPGYVGIINSENITIKDITITNNVQGIYLENTIHSRIENTHLSNNLMGIEMNKDSENEVVGNELSNNIWNGIRLWVSSHNLITDNDVLDNGIGIELTGPSGGYSHDNKIFHNNFKNNQTHAVANMSENDLFNDGYPSGGNYWSGYTGIDEKSGENQDQPGSDGIGDTPYTFYYMKQDRYPFMNESGWGVTDVPLYTQVVSPYPSEAATDAWDHLEYGTGNYKDCFDIELNYSAIRNCGCAITSIVMLGRYYNIEMGTDGSDTNPANINNWLTNHNGYVRGGRLKWGKGIEYLGFIDEITGKKMVRLNFDHYNASASIDIEEIDNYITSAKPVIARSDRFGHYFVIDNKDNNTYKIKDPLWYNTETLNDDKNISNHIQDYDNHFDIANLFSYLPTPKPLRASIYIYLASPAELLVIDPLGRKLGRDPVTDIAYNEIPDSSYTKDGSIMSSDVPINLEGIHGRVIYISYPLNGEYNIKVIGIDSGSYALDFSVYNEVGEATDINLEGIIDKGVTSNYSLNYNSNPQEPTEVERVITMADAIEDVKISYDLDWITKKWVRDLLILKLKIAQKLEQKKAYKAATEILRLFIVEVKFYNKKGFINDQAKTLLTNDVQYIIEHL